MEPKLQHEESALFNEACHVCDKLLNIQALPLGHRAHCPRCGTLVSQQLEFSFQKSIAYSVSSIILLLSTFFFPVVGFSASGQHRSMTLIDSGISLIINDERILGWVVLILIVVLPLVIMILLITLLVSLQLQFQHKAIYWLARLYFNFRDWNMIEVYVIGLLVSLSKIASLARIELGTSFWALIGFSAFLLMANYNIDRHHVWQTIKLGRGQ